MNWKHLFKLNLTLYKMNNKNFLIIHKTNKNYLMNWKTLFNNNFKNFNIEINIILIFFQVLSFIKIFKDNIQINKMFLL